MNILRKIFFLCAITSLPSGEGLFAQTGKAPRFSFTPAPPATVQATDGTAMQATAGQQMRLGYCDDGNGGTVRPYEQTTGSHTFGGAIYFPASILNKYAGDTIKSVTFAVNPARGKRAVVFVTKELGGTNLSQASVSSYVTGWNEVALTKPVVIQADQPLYIGYNILTNAGEACDFVQFGFSTAGEAGANYYGLDGNWYYAGTSVGNLRIRANIAGENIPNCDVGISKATSLDGFYLEQNMYAGFSIEVRNYGLDPIESITFTGESDGVSGGETTVELLNIKHNETETFNLDELCIPVEGNVTFNIKAVKVNGKEDPDESDNTTAVRAFARREGTNREKRHVLFEQFTSEAYEDSPLADSLYALCLADRNDVVWVKHHVGYGSFTDQFTLSAESPYLELFSDGKRFVPAIAVDRNRFTNTEEAGPAYFVADSTMVEGLVTASEEVPTFITLDVSAQAGEDGSTVTATVSGEAGTKEMPNQNDLRLTVWLVEDGISSTQQAGRSTYIQNGVIRALLSESAWGDPLDISSYTFERTYSVAAGQDWNLEKMRVVAIVNNYAQSAFARYVYQAAQGFLGKASSISSAQGLPEEAVCVKNGKLCVADGYRINGVYDMAGRQMDAENLTQGVYVVKVAGTQSSATAKIVIR